MEQEQSKSNERLEQAHTEHTNAAHVKKTGPDRFWKLATVFLIVLLAFFVLRGNPNSGGPTGGAAGNVPNDIVAPRAEVSADDDPYLGKKDAPVTIIEFSDYECPFCGRFFSDTLPQIKNKYIDAGKVRLVYRDFPLNFHPEAMPAALAANCAGEQGKYFQFHDKIFENQGSLSSANYKKWAQELGLNVAKWETCIKDPKQAEEIKKDLRDGTASGVQGTPAFFVNGQLVSGAQPFSVFEQIIDAELKK